MAVLYNPTPYNCGRYQAEGWDSDCAQDEIWVCPPSEVAEVEEVPE
jgi:hypothetical protein